MAEACATLRLPFRRKNLSESEKSEQDKENQNPSCSSASTSGGNNHLKSSNDQSRFLDHHRLMLQEHVRRIRGRQLEEEQELHEHHDQHPEQQQPKTSSSPQRANR